MTVKRVLKLKVLTQNELVKVETSARTFGEFKTEVANLGIDWSSAKLIDRASKATYEVDEAVLPATDAIMFVMPTKSKAGCDLPYKEVKELVRDFKAAGGNVPFNYTQASTEQLNAFWNAVNKVDEVAKNIDEEINEETEENVSEVIYLKPGVYTLIVESDLDDVEEINLIDYTTEEDLQDEAEALKEALK